MAQGGSGRTGGKARPAGRGTAGGRGTGGRGGSTAKTSGRGGGTGRGGGQRPKQSAAAAQKAIQGARRGGTLVRVVLPIVVIVVVAAVVVTGVLLANKRTEASGQQNPNNADTSTGTLASTAGQSTGDAVDGVQSNANEQILFHVHAHLAIYVNGKQKLLPYGVGIVPPYQLQADGNSQFVVGGSKFYWLHTHDETGVIHIESPVQRTFTLGNFFDVWRQPLSNNQVGPSKGQVTAYLDGKKYTGDVRNIPLKAHGQIQIDVGTVVPFQKYTFPQGL
ncbi:MAG TPA: hypothetical protein VHV49_07645 [Pseudonocardiaceae bacterium]|jgi:hypothetical protein|nr:hypothetical protein [Pseudonocardiaceae bacterium]